MAVLTSQVASAMLKIPASEPLAVPSLEYFCHLCFHASGFGIFFSNDSNKPTSMTSPSLVLLSNDLIHCSSSLVSTLPLYNYGSKGMIRCRASWWAAVSAALSWPLMAVWTVQLKGLCHLHSKFTWSSNCVVSYYWSPIQHQSKPQQTSGKWALLFSISNLVSACNLPTNWPNPICPPLSCLDKLWNCQC